MFDRKKSNQEQTDEFVDAVKYTFKDYSEYLRTPNPMHLDEFYIPSLKIVFNAVAEFRCEEARNVDHGHPLHNDKVKTISPLENVKLSKSLVELIHASVTAREALEERRKQLVNDYDYKELLGLNKKLKLSNS